MSTKHKTIYYVKCCGATYSKPWERSIPSSETLHELNNVNNDSEDSEFDPINVLNKKNPRT